MTQKQNERIVEMMNNLVNSDSWKYVVEQIQPFIDQTKNIILQDFTGNLNEKVYTKFDLLKIKLLMMETFVQSPHDVIRKYDYDVQKLDNE